MADYTKAARKIIKDINSRGRLPIVVGGTGLYINALADNTAFITEKADGMLRDRLEKRFDSIGGMAMLKELEAIDPVSAAKLHPNDRKRIVRALEVYSLTGETKTRQNELSKTGEKIINPLFIGITYKDRQRLYDRINLRVDKMLENGLLNEINEYLGCDILKNPAVFSAVRNGLGATDCCFFCSLLGLGAATGCLVVFGFCISSKTSQKPLSGTLSSSATISLSG